MYNIGVDIEHYHTSLHMYTIVDHFFQNELAHSAYKL